MGSSRNGKVRFWRMPNTHGGRVNCDTNEARISRFFGGYSFSIMMRSSLVDPQEVNRALLCDVQIQEDVKMYSRLSHYDDFRGFGVSRGGCFRDLRNRHGRILNATYLTRIYPGN